MSGQGGNQQWQASSGPAPVNYPTSTGPNQYWGSQNQFGGGPQAQGGQPLWQNPFSPMTSADWAALENKHFPSTRLQDIQDRDKWAGELSASDQAFLAESRGPAPEPGTAAHARMLFGSTPSIGQRNWYATLFGERVGPAGGAGANIGEQGGDEKYYLWEGQRYEAHRGLERWGEENIGGFSGTTESWGGPSPNPGAFSTIAGWLQEHTPFGHFPQSWMAVTRPGWIPGGTEAGLGGTPSGTDPGSWGGDPGTETEAGNY